MFEAARAGLDADAIMDALTREGVMTTTLRRGSIRMVTHHDVTRDDVDAALRAFKNILK
jgi:threonine aldolase